MMFELNFVQEHCCDVVVVVAIDVCVCVLHKCISLGRIIPLCTAQTAIAVVDDETGEEKPQTGDHNVLTSDLR